MTEPLKPESDNHSITLGRYWVNRDAKDELKHLRSKVGFHGGVWAIPLTQADLKRIDECIAFNEGAQVSPQQG